MVQSGVVGFADLSVDVATVHLATATATTTDGVASVSSNDSTFGVGLALLVGVLLVLAVYRRYKATAPGLDPGVEADNTQPLLRLGAIKS